jgi:hypothetical protein
MPECRIIFENKTPDFWAVTITGIGANFFYKKPDGTPTGSFSTAKAVSLKTGQSDQLLNAKDRRACVGSIIAIFECEVPGQGKVIKTKPGSVAPNECATQWEVCIQPEGLEGQFKTMQEALDAINFGVTVLPGTKTAKL